MGLLDRQGSLRRSLSKSGVSLLYENNLAAYCKNMCHCVCDSKRTARREGERGKEGRRKEGSLILPLGSYCHFLHLLAQAKSRS